MSDTSDTIDADHNTAWIRKLTLQQLADLIDHPDPESTVAEAQQIVDTLDSRLVHHIFDILRPLSLSAGHIQRILGLASQEMASMTLHIPEYPDTQTPSSE